MMAPGGGSWFASDTGDIRKRETCSSTH